jgi:hypothetical protein
MTRRPPMLALASLSLALSFLSTPALAQTAAAPAKASEPSILDRAVNQPGTNWSFYGPNKAKAVKVEGVPGNEAVQVTIDRAGAHPYDTGAVSPIQKPIAAGDTVLVAVYMRAPLLRAGETTPVPFFGATEGDAPYTNIAGSNADIGPDWKLYRAAAKSPKGFAAGKARATVHLAAAKHVVELGPIFVLDYKNDADPAALLK